MDAASLAALVASFTGLIGGVTAYITSRATKKKTTAEHDSIVVEASEAVVNLLRSELDRLQVRLANCMAKCYKLERRLDEAGIPIPALEDPVPDP